MPAARAFVGQRPICVRHRDGWCATRKTTLAYADNIKTLCGWYVCLPWSIERRTPDCPKCKAKLNAMRRRARS